MSKYRKRFVVSLTSLTLIGVLIWVLVPYLRSVIRTEDGNQATGKINLGWDMEIRATSASKNHPVHIDVSPYYSADVHFGDDVIQIKEFYATYRGDVIADLSGGSRLVELKQTKDGIRVWLDGVEVSPKFAEAVKRKKESDLKTFDELRNDFENADLFELISLDPNVGDGLTLGKTEIRDRATRTKLLDALRKGIVEFNHISSALCFEPRHEIYAKRNGLMHCLVICFECNQVKVLGNKQFQVADTPQPVFDQVLRDAGVPLPKPAKK